MEIPWFEKPAIQIEMSTLETDPQNATEFPPPRIQTILSHEWVDWRCRPYWTYEEYKMEINNALPRPPGHFAIIYKNTYFKIPYQIFEILLLFG